MTALEYILDGLEAELALERELGVRVVECDRSVLATSSSAVVRPSSAVVRPLSAVGSPSSAVDGQRTADSGQRPEDDERRPTDNGQTTGARPDFVFLHDRPLSPKAIEMMAKIITAMGKTVETAPIVIAPPRPPAKAYVVLGGFALRKFFPGAKAEPGQWITGEKGEPALVTYSPEYILRFGTVTPAVKKMKQDMWTSLKGVLQRTR